MRRLTGVVFPTLVMVVGASAQQVHIGSGSISQTVTALKPGQYVWEPVAAPDGPLLLVVSLPRQRAILFRNGVPIAATTISSGRKGYETPIGVFTVLQKRKEHYSSTYDNAPMPFMQRLTWRGVALHAGKLPGHPASHGCVRLPLDFAKLLFATTHVGMTVVVSDKATTPRVAPAPSLLSQQSPISPALAFWQPQRSPTGPVSVIVSAADRQAVVLRGGREIGRAPVRIDGPVTGSWVYQLRQENSAAPSWVRVDMSVEGDPVAAVAPEEWRRFHAPDDFRKAVAAILVSGATIVVTADTLDEMGTGAPTAVLEASPGK